MFKNADGGEEPTPTYPHLFDLDRHHLWHPYSTMPGLDSWLVTGAQGVYLDLTTADGERITAIDGMSSWWAAAFGYRHPALDAAAHKQIDSFSHVMFGGLTHQPAATAAERLLALTHPSLANVFFCDSGSVSVEVAAKMALQYWQSHPDPSEHKRTRLLTWRGGYHGDTLTPMSVCDPDGGMHSLWTGILPQQFFLPRPPDDPSTSLCPSSQDPQQENAAYLQQVEQMLNDHGQEIAALIIEPVVQGAGGMRFHQPELLRRVVELCRDANLLIIFDEIATGCGRTGTFFAYEACDVVPDILCLGKALTGGYLTAAAVVSQPHISTVISRGTGPFMHGPTFMANPLSCAIAAEALQLAVDYQQQGVPRRIERELREGLAPACDIPGVRDIRVKGAIGVIELENPCTMVTATRAALDKGVWIRPFGRLLYTMPPYICTSQQIATICDALCAAAQAEHA